MTWQFIIILRTTEKPLAPHLFLQPRWGIGKSLSPASFWITLIRLVMSCGVQAEEDRTELSEAIMDIPPCFTNSNSVKHFELNALCFPMQVVTDLTNSDSKKINHKEAMIENALESRLRTAYLYTADTWVVEVLSLCPVLHTTIKLVNFPYAIYPEIRTPMS